MKNEPSTNTQKNDRAKKIWTVWEVCSWDILESAAMASAGTGFAVAAVIPNNPYPLLTAATAVVWFGAAVNTTRKVKRKLSRFDASKPTLG